MKKFKQITYQQTKIERERKITKIIHDLPTWMFPELSDYKCPICIHELPQQIGHGVQIERCSYVQLDGFEVTPIHTECYNNLPMDEKE